MNPLPPTKPLVDALLERVTLPDNYSAELYRRDLSVLVEGIRKAAKLPTDSAIGERTGLVAYHRTIKAEPCKGQLPNLGMRIRPQHKRTRPTRKVGAPMGIPIAINKTPDRTSKFYHASRNILQLQHGQWLIHLDDNCNGPWLSLLIGSIIMCTYLRERGHRYESTTFDDGASDPHCIVQLLDNVFASLPSIWNVTSEAIDHYRDIQPHIYIWLNKLLREDADPPIPEQRTTPVNEYDKDAMVKAIQAARRLTSRMLKQAPGHSPLRRKLTSLYELLNEAATTAEALPDNFPGETGQRIERERLAIELIVLFTSLDDSRTNRSNKYGRAVALLEGALNPSDENGDTTNRRTISRACDKAVSVISSIDKRVPEIAPECWLTSYWGLLRAAKVEHDCQIEQERSENFKTEG